MTTSTRMCPVRLPRSKNEARKKSQVALNVLVPLGGLNANEFVEAGYRLPKPMVPIVGRPMILWMFDNLELQDGDHVWLGLRRDIEEKFSISSLLKREHPRLEVRVVCFDFETRGATETLYCILNAMDAQSRKRRTISLDSDTLWFCDVLGGARALPEKVGASFYFNDTSDDANAPYSYIRVRGERIMDIREKVAISRLANNGAYVFESGDAALKGLESLLDEAIQPHPVPAQSPALGGGSGGVLDKGVALEDFEAFHHDTVSIDGSLAFLDDSERTKYVSGLISHMMRREGKTFLAVLANDFANLGSPAKLRNFINRLRRGEVVGARAMRFCFGLDGTLLTTRDNEPPPLTSSNDDDAHDFGRGHHHRTTTKNGGGGHHHQLNHHHHQNNNNGGSSSTFRRCEPIAKNIAIARELHEAGHTIIVWTDRGMRDSGGSAARAMAEIGRLTFEQLEKFGIPHDEVVFGKPHADVYVDSRAVNPLLGDTFEDAIGWDLCGDNDSATTAKKNSDLESGVAPRHFNSLRRVGDDHVEKTGPRSVLRGEIYWYQHVPPELADLFPAASAVREHPAQELSSVVLGRVVGVTFSHLVVNSCVTPGRLTLLLNSLNRLHLCRAAAAKVIQHHDHETTTTAPHPTTTAKLITTAHPTTTGSSVTSTTTTTSQHPPPLVPPPPPSTSMMTPPSAPHKAFEDVTDEMLCQNYYSKVQKRFQKHRAFFASFDDDVDSKKIADVVLKELTKFQERKRFKRAQYIHGDPVFSNVMLTTDAKVKFIDMRGSLGDVLTTAGDVCYDLSKTFQSLCGYDFIILDVPRTDTADAVLRHLRDTVFASWLKHNHPDIDLKDIKILTAAHFFCIVPLHENRAHQSAFLKMADTLLRDIGLFSSEEESAESAESSS